MKLKEKCLWFGTIVLFATLLLPGRAAAQRTVHWQINPQGFPAETSVFVDIEDAGAYKRDLPPASFKVSMDEFAAQQGGIIMNANLQGAQSTAAGWTGAQVLIMIDVSQSYKKDFSRAKKAAQALVNGMDPNRDEVAIAVFPTEAGYSESQLVQPFSNNKDALKKVIDGIKHVSDDEKGGRICNALSEGLHFFPETNKGKYRSVMYLTGGADKGEGKGSCVKDSHASGVVPFWSMIFKLDRKYDNPKNAHKIENGAHDLAKNTAGRSLFRKSDTSFASFAGQAFWNRIRSQYRLLVNFMCYSPAPQIQHTSVLKVDETSYTPIKFTATSASSPVPVITALYPQSAYRTHIDDGKIELTIDGSGFCGAPGQVRVAVGGRQVQTSSAAPYRVVVKLNSTVEAGAVKVVN